VTTVCYLSKYLHFDNYYISLYSLFETNMIGTVTRKRNDFHFSRIQNTNLYIFTKYLIKYILIEIFMFLPLYSFPALSIYIILCHSDIFLPVPSPSDIKNITKRSLSLTILKLSVLLHILILPYYLQQIIFGMRNINLRISKY